MPEKKANKIGAFIGWLAALIASTSAVLTFIGWLMYPHAEKAVMDIVNKNKGTSLRTDLSEALFIEREDVDDEIGWMYDVVIHLMESKDDMALKWAPHLEEEVKWIRIGYVVNIADPTIVKYHHTNGRVYDAWVNESGILCHVRNGYTYH